MACFSVAKVITDVFLKLGVLAANDHWTKMLKNCSIDLPNGKV